MSFLDKLRELDYQTFISLNKHFYGWLDQPMFLFSSDWFWIPLYGFLIFLLVKRYRKKSWLPILFVFLGVILSDQTSNTIKKSIKRPRPSHDPVLKDRVHTINNYKGGKYGFVSSHAANTFCIAIMITSFLYLSLTSTTLLFFWATLVTYSRIYLGVHFPLDVLGGALVGIIIGIILIIVKKRVELTYFSNS